MTLIANFKNECNLTNIGKGKHVLTNVHLIHHQMKKLQITYWGNTQLNFSNNFFSKRNLSYIYYKLFSVANNSKWRILVVKPHVLLSKMVIDWRQEWMLNPFFFWNHFPATVCDAKLFYDSNRFHGPPRYFTLLLA